VKNALALKNHNPERKVHVLYRDLSMVKEEHFQLDAAKAAGVKFIRFPENRYPEVTKEGDQIKVKVYDILIGNEFTLPADLLVLTVGFEGDETIETVKGQLKVSINSEGFFQERHIKLGPLDFPADGIALCGCAKNPRL
jgi:heterodisulfide reductase subunit A